MGDVRERGRADTSEDEQSAGPATGKATGNEVKVLSCAACEGPVASSTEKCFACGAPLTGREFPYITRRPAGPDIAGMLRWWAVLSVIVFALGGFSFGVGSTIAFSALTLVYGVRMLRAYFS